MRTGYGQGVATPPPPWAKLATKNGTPWRETPIFFS